MGAVCDTVRTTAREASDGHMIFCHIPIEELRRVPAMFQRGEAELVNVGAT